MNPLNKRNIHRHDPWIEVNYIDNVYYGRNVCFSDWDKFENRKKLKVYSRQEWVDMVSNTAWYNGLNPVVMWDKPKKELLENWKKDGRVVMARNLHE